MATSLALAWTTTASLLVSCAAMPTSASPPEGGAPEAWGGTGFRADGMVYSLSIANSGLMATLDEYGAILLFQLPEGRRIGAVPSPCGRSGGSWQVALSPDGGHLAVACWDGVAIRALEEGGRWSARVPVDVAHHALAMQWSDDGSALMIDGDGPLLLDAAGWEIARGAGPDPLLPVAPGIWAGTHSYDGSDPVRAWSPEKGELWSQKLPIGAYDAVRGIARVDGPAPLAVFTDGKVYWFKLDGTFTATGWAGSFLEIAGVGGEIWYVDNGGTIHRVGPGGAPRGEVGRALGHALHASQDGRWVAQDGAGRVQAWRGDGTLLTPIEGLSGGAVDLRWSPDGRFLAATDGDRVVRLDRKTGHLRTAPVVEAHEVHVLDGGAIFFLGSGGVWRWAPDALAPQPVLVDDDTRILWFYLDRAGTLFIASQPDEDHPERATLARWSTSPLRRIGSAPLPAQSSWGRGSPSPDGRHVLVEPFTADDACIRGAATGELVTGLGEIDDAVWIEDGTARIVATSHDDLDGPEIWTWPGEAPRSGEGWPGRTLVLSDDARRAVSWDDGALVVWDVASRQAHQRIPTAEPTAMRFSPDGLLIAWTGSDGLLRVGGVEP